MSRIKESFPLVLALCVGLIGSLMAYKWVQSQAGRAGLPRAEAAPGNETVSIVVAQEGLAWGTKLSAGLVEDKLVMKPYLKETAPPGCFQDLEEVQGRVLLSPVSKGQPILESDLAPADVNKGGIGALIRPGYRAMTVQADCGFGATGFIEPGDRVDVLVTIDDREKNRAVTKTVLENVTVLAAGNRAGERGEDADPGDAGTPGAGPDEVYTLMVSPDEGEKLALAASRGRLHFAMRNALDQREILTKGATVGDTLASFLDAPPPAPEKKPRAAAPRAQVNRVEIIKGTDVSTLTF